MIVNVDTSKVNKKVFNKNIVHFKLPLTNKNIRNAIT